MEGDDGAAIKRDSEALSQEMQKIGSRVAEGQKAEGDVKDAEFKEKKDDDGAKDGNA